MTRLARGPILVWISGLLLLCSGPGCTTTSTSNTKRTGTEQLLVSNAIDRALEQADFSSLEGHRVFVDPQFLDCVDKSYVIASTRHHLLHSGALVVDKLEDCGVRLEIRTGAVGTDTSEALLGIPEITLPGLMTLPEVQVATRSRQTGVAKLGFVAYQMDSQRQLPGGGISLAQSDDSNWYVLGVGPYRDGTLVDEFGRSSATQQQNVPNRLPANVAFRAADSMEPRPPDPIRLTGEEQATGQQPARGADFATAKEATTGEDKAGSETSIRDAPPAVEDGLEPHDKPAGSR